MIELIQLRSFADLDVQTHALRVDDINNAWRFVRDNELPSHCQASIANLIARAKEAVGTEAHILVQFGLDEQELTVLYRDNNQMHVVPVDSLPSTAQAALQNVKTTLATLFPSIV